MSFDYYASKTFISRKKNSNNIIKIDDKILVYVDSKYDEIIENSNYYDLMKSDIISENNKEYLCISIKFFFVVLGLQNINILVDYNLYKYDNGDNYCSIYFKNYINRLKKFKIIINKFIIRKKVNLLFDLFYNNINKDGLNRLSFISFYNL